VTAPHAGDGNYTAAADVPQAFTVGQAAQTITFGALSDKVLADVSFTVSATGGASGNPLTFAATAESAGICEVSGTTVTLIGVGTCTVTASQLGTANYLAAADVAQSFEVKP
jgi:hypothetical protein